MNKVNSGQFIKDYLKDKLSAKQNASLETWYLLKAEESDTPEPQVDFERLDAKIWVKILDEVNVSEQAEVKVRKLNSTYKNLIRFGVAASILLIAGISYLLLNHENAQGDKFVIAKEQDLPAGTNKAMLTLSNGQVIDLDKNDNVKIAVEAGVEITKAADGKLVYKVIGKGNKDAGFNTIRTPAGGQYAVVLPDGSKVWLNAGSSLKYPTSFAANNRNVTLSGEAYFEVAHMKGPEGRLPFSVSVIKGDSQLERVEVLGTHFNINAYADEPSAKTTLLKGSIRIGLNNGHSTLLKPGQQATLNNQQVQLRYVDTEVSVAWKDGEFVFREDLRSAMRKVARWYDVEVVYEETAPEKLMLGGWMSRGINLSAVLNHIQSTGKVHFKLEGRRVIVSK